MYFRDAADFDSHFKLRLAAALRTIRRSRDPGAMSASAQQVVIQTLDEMVRSGDLVVDMQRLAEKRVYNLTQLADKARVSFQRGTITIDSIELSECLFPPGDGYDGPVRYTVDLSDETRRALDRVPPEEARQILQLAERGLDRSQRRRVLFGSRPLGDGIPYTPVIQSPTGVRQYMPPVEMPPSSRPPVPPPIQPIPPQAPPPAQSNRFDTFYIAPDQPVTVRPWPGPPPPNPRLQPQSFSATQMARERLTQSRQRLREAMGIPEPTPAQRGPSLSEFSQVLEEHAEPDNRDVINEQVDRVLLQIARAREAGENVNNHIQELIGLMNQSGVTRVRASQMSDADLAALFSPMPTTRIQNLPPIDPPPPERRPGRRGRQARRQAEETPVVEEKEEKTDREYGRKLDLDFGDE